MIRSEPGINLVLINLGLYYPLKSIDKHGRGITWVHPTLSSLSLHFVFYLNYLTSIPGVHILLNKAVGCSDDPAGGDDGTPTDMFPPPVHADLPAPLLIGRQRPPDDASAIAGQNRAVWVWEDNEKGDGNGEC